MDYISHVVIFWSIIENPEDDPENVVEVACKESVKSSDRLTFSSSIRDVSIPPPVVSSSVAAVSGLAPSLTHNQAFTPNMVYTIPPPPVSVLHSREVIEKARTLNLYPDQEHMRYVIARSLTHADHKHTTSKGMFAKLKKLGSGRK